MMVDGSTRTHTNDDDNIHTITRVLTICLGSAKRLTESTYARIPHVLEKIKPNKMKRRGRK